MRWCRGTAAPNIALFSRLWSPTGVLLKTVFKSAIVQYLFAQELKHYKRYWEWFLAEKSRATPNYAPGQRTRVYRELMVLPMRMTHTLASDCIGLILIGIVVMHMGPWGKPARASAVPRCKSQDPRTVTRPRSGIRRGEPELRMRITETNFMRDIL